MDVVPVTPYVESVSMPNFTRETVFEPVPPKKPVPVTSRVVSERLDPVVTLRSVTAGAAVVTVRGVEEVTVPPGVPS